MSEEDGQLSSSADRREKLVDLELVSANESIDSSQQQSSRYHLFDAYRQGQIDPADCSTQPSGPAPPLPPVTSTAESLVTGDIKTSVTASSAPSTTAAGVLPRSWALPSSSSTSSTTARAKVGLGAFLTSTKPFTAPMVVNVQPPIQGLIKPLPERVEYVAKEKSAYRSAIQVNECQRGNPLLKFLQNTPWEYAGIEPDYVVGRNHCVYFLSLRYHQLNPEHIFDRVKRTRTQYQLSVLLAQVDLVDPHYTLKELAKLALTQQLTLMLAWSPQEAARYLEAYKSLELKPPDLLMNPDQQQQFSRQRPTSDQTEAASSEQSTTTGGAYQKRVETCLTSIRRVTKTDAAVLLGKFETLANLIGTSEADLEQCPGVGHVKLESNPDASNVFDTDINRLHYNKLFQMEGT